MAMIIPADGEAIAMRRRIMREGVLIVAVTAISIRGSQLGLPLDEDYDDFVAEATADITAAIGKLRGGDRRDDRACTKPHGLPRDGRRSAGRASGPQVP